MSKKFKILDFRMLGNKWFILKFKGDINILSDIVWNDIKHLGNYYHVDTWENIENTKTQRIVAFRMKKYKVANTELKDIKILFDEEKRKDIDLKEIFGEIYQLED